jgi:hypothetical protein
MTDDYDDDLIVDDSQYDDDTGGVETQEPKELQEPTDQIEQDVEASEAKPEKKPSRYEKRVLELKGKNKYAEAQVKELAEQNEALRQQLLNAQAKLNETSAAQNAERVKKLRQEKVDALHIEDFDRVAEIDDELVDIRLETRQNPVYQAPTPKAADLTTPSPVDNRTEDQIDYENSHSDLLKDPVQIERVNTTLRGLVNSGVAPHDPQLWTLLEYETKYQGRLNSTATMQKAKRIVERLVNEAGIDYKDPKILTLLDRNMNRTKPPAPVGNGAGGDTREGTNVTGLTRADLEQMKALGYDPKNKVFQDQFLRAKRAAANG